MSFKEHDKQTFIADSAQRLRRPHASPSASSCAGWRSPASASRPSRAGLLGGNGRPYRGGLGIGDGAPAPRTARRLTKWLKDVGTKYKGTKIRYTSEATPPTVVVNQIKNEFTDPTGIEVEVEIVPLEQVLAKATQDVQGQLGTYDLYYLDQSWVATFAQDTVDPREHYKAKPDLAMPGFDWDDFSKPLVDGLAMYDGKMVGIPFDIPIFILMYRKDMLEKHGIKVPTTLGRVHGRGAEDHRRPRRRNGIYGTALQAKSGHYSLECDWTGAVWGHGGSIFGKDKKFTGNDEQAHQRPEMVPGARQERAARLDRLRPGTASSR